jgi:hypothetical protein
MLILSVLAVVNLATPKLLVGNHRFVSYAKQVTMWWKGVLFSKDPIRLLDILVVLLLG